jgi:pimeloyl-ACP methyl ester carboxylesterase
VPLPFRIHIEEDRVVRGDYFPAAAEGPAIGTLIICHGFKGFKDWGMFPHVAYLLSNKLDVVLINFSYNGVGEKLDEFTELEKFAKETYAIDLEDLDAAIQYIQSEDVFQRKSKGSQPLFLLGHSRGAGVCLIYAMDHPDAVSGVISWNGITDVDLLSKENKEEMSAAGRSYTLNGRTGQNMPLDLEIMLDMEQNRDRYNIKERIRTVSFPVHLIQGSDDSARLREGSRQLVSNNPAVEWTLIPGGNHTFGAVHPYQGATKPMLHAIDATYQAIRRMAISQQL